MDVPGWSSPSDVLVLHLCPLYLFHYFLRCIFVLLFHEYQLSPQRTGQARTEVGWRDMSQQGLPGGWPGHSMVRHRPTWRPARRSPLEGAQRVPYRRQELPPVSARPTAPSSGGVAAPSRRPAPPTRARVLTAAPVLGGCHSQGRTGSPGRPTLKDPLPVTRASGLRAGPGCGPRLAGTAGRPGRAPAQHCAS